MKLLKRNLKTVKNQLLCELEDFLIDGILPALSKKTMNKKEEEKFATDLMNNILNSVKTNATRFAIICYTTEDGKDLTESDLEGIPLKLKIITECLEDIMGIMSDYIQGDEEQAPAGKPRTIRKR